MDRMERVAPSEKILRAADELFYQEGIRAVGMDDVKEQAGVALRTLYKYFPSKEALVRAYLKQRDEKWRAWLANYVEQSANPGEQLLAIFDALEGWFSSENYRGCAFINAAGESAEEASDASRLAGEHKRAVGDYVEWLVKEAGYPSPEDISRKLTLIVEGAIITSYVEGDLHAARRAKEIAKIILKSEDTV